MAAPMSPPLRRHRRLFARGLERHAEDQATLKLRRNLRVHDHSLELLGLSERGMIYLEGQRLPHRRAERLVGRLFGVVVELQRALNRVDEAANVFPPAARGIVGRDLNLFRLLLRQHRVAAQAGNESRGSALHQIDLGSKARLLRHYSCRLLISISSPPNSSAMASMMRVVSRCVSSARSGTDKCSDSIPRATKKAATWLPLPRSIRPL